jgi:RimJ/RimL family protein N-acetyltransferase
LLWPGWAAIIGFVHLSDGMGLRLRPLGGRDRALSERVSQPEVAGEWDSFDDPPDEMLPSARFAGSTLVIELADGTAAGVVSSIRVPYGPNARSLAYRIGITVLPEPRNRGIGAAAQRLLADRLLSQPDVNRVEADTDVGNIPEQRALERAGFTREGVVRGAQWRRGGWHDRVLYGRLRSDP